MTADNPRPPDEYAGRDFRRGMVCGMGIAIACQVVVAILIVVGVRSGAL